MLNVLVSIFAKYDSQKEKGLSSFSLKKKFKDKDINSNWRQMGFHDILLYDILRM